MVFLILVVAFISALILWFFVFVAIVYWSINEIGMDIMDFCKQSLQDLFPLVERKFIDRVKLVCWRIKRTSCNLTEFDLDCLKTVCEAHHNTFNELHANRNTINFELAIGETEDTILVQEISISIPREMKWTVWRLFFAGSFLLSPFFFAKDHS